MCYVNFNGVRLNSFSYQGFFCDIILTYQSHMRGTPPAGPTLFLHWVLNMYESEERKNLKITRAQLILVELWVWGHVYMSWGCIEYKMAPEWVYGMSWSCQSITLIYWDQKNPVDLSATEVIQLWRMSQKMGEIFRKIPRKIPHAFEHEKSEQLSLWRGGEVDWSGRGSGSER